MNKRENLKEDYINFLVNGIKLKYFNISLIDCINAELTAESDYALELEGGSSWAIQNWDRDIVASFHIDYSMDEDVYIAKVFREKRGADNKLLGKLFMIIMSAIYWWDR